MQVYSNMRCRAILCAMEREFGYMDAHPTAITAHSRKAVQMRRAHTQLTTAGIGCMGMERRQRTRVDLQAAHEEVRVEAAVAAFGHKAEFAIDAKSKTAVMADNSDEALADRTGKKRRTPIVKCVSPSAVLWLLFAKMLCHGIGRAGFRSPCVSLLTLTGSTPPHRPISCAPLHIKMTLPMHGPVSQLGLARNMNMMCADWASAPCLPTASG